ncbi:uncharacterized protein LOC126705074 [Quercus robur]|uniref:uncharacterized protein LOC126705074 n=1 Tax=Quercus robur TaxID=38942 RepID=UPI0021627D8D|nr:uncharacterized protein LOC126705074 [Quercus robur]
MATGISKLMMDNFRAKAEDEINILTNPRLLKDKEKEPQSNFAEKKEVETLLMAVQANQEPESDVWYVDTGCSNHMCGICFGDCSTVKVMGKGDIEIRTKNGFVETISNVFYVLDLKSNLLSAGQLQEKDLISGIPTASSKPPMSAYDSSGAFSTFITDTIGST